jgi:ATPase subunit of ABC transporter with duplicated ATPase domains
MCGRSGGSKRNRRQRNLEAIRRQQEAAAREQARQREEQARREAARRQEQAATRAAAEANARAAEMRKSYESMAAATREQTAALVPPKPEVKAAATTTQSLAEAIEADKEDSSMRRSFLTPPTSKRVDRPSGGGVKTRRLARKDRRGRRSLRNTLSAAARLNIQRGSSNIQV